MSTENLQDVYPLTPMQEGMLFHYLLDKEKYRDRYIYQFVITLKGTIDIQALEKSFQKLVDTYDILRTVFRYEGVQKPLQVVLKQRKIHLRVEDPGDMSNLSLEEKEQQIEDLIGLDKRQPFDLTRDLPMRVCLLKTGSDIFILGWSLHHIIADGWSVGILCRELIRIYSALIGNAGIKQTIKPPPTFPFRKYMEWLAGRDRDRDRQYWYEYLQGYETHVILPEMEKDTNTIEDEFQESELVLTLQPGLVSKLENLVSVRQITANILIQCTWAILLQHYNNTPDVVFGVVVSGRPPELYGIEDMVGLFINTIPLRIISHPDMPFSQLLQDIKKETAATKAHEHISLAEIQAQSLLKSQLIGHIIAFENYPLEEEVKHWGPSASANQTQGFIVQEVKMKGQAHYSFYIIIIPGDKMRVLFKYNACIYSEQFIQKMSMHFNKLLLQIVENPEILIGELEILSDRERNQLIYEFNQTAIEYPREKTLHQLWMEQVECTPDRLAVTAPTKINCKRNIANVTHRQLYRNSEQLAELLGKEGIGPAAVVALLLEPSVEMMTGIWGTLLAGAIYLPVDPGFPRNRIDYTLADSATKILLTTSTLVQENINLKELGIKKIFLDRIEPFPFAHEIPGPKKCSSNNSPVYVLYTSGTTGRPKGVLSNHGNVVNHISWFCRAGGITCEDRIVLVSSYAFDLVYTAVYSCLIKGGNLHLVNREIYLWPEKFWNYVRDHRITYLKSTPSFFQFMVNTPFFSAANCRNLKLIVIGGEPINITVVEKFFQAQGNLRIINHYGPTETTIGSVIYMIDAGNIESFQALPVIGRPIDNDFAYILGKNRELLPIGVPGEIYIAGAGICPGYLNQPELTADRFKRNVISQGSFVNGKFQTDHNPLNLTNDQCPMTNDYFYRTGDLGRWLPNGTIQCLGRVDRQVKIRGFRIELPEIENYLRQLDQIEDAAVVIKEDAGEKSLWAYIVPAAKEKGEKPFDIPALMSFLEQQLPSYMVPAQIIPITSIPLTPNGKIDQRRLPDPGINMEQPAMEEYIPPCNEKETKMQAIWAEILGIDKNKIGMNTNFFHIGGHSLKVMMMVLKIHKELGIRISLAKVFKHPQIREILTLHEENSSPYISLQPVEKKDYYETSPAQKRLFVLQQMVGENTSYNIPILQELEGEVDINKFENIFTNIFIRHEILRTSFQLKDGRLIQRVHKREELEFKIEYFHVGGGAQECLVGQEQDLIRRFIRPFDLSHAPLFRVGIIRINNSHHILMVDLHHIVSDGVSHSLLIRDFESFYNGKSQPQVAIQYKDYAEWQNQEKQKLAIKKQESYWLNQLQGELPVMELPYDYPRPAVRDFSGQTINFQFGNIETSRLKQFTQEQPGITLFMVLVSIINIWLSRLSRLEDIAIGIPISGRRHADLDQTIGMFVNTLVLRNFPYGEISFNQFLNQVKQITLQAYENQDYPFEEVVENPGLDIRRDASRNPLFDVMFVLQNIEMSQPQFPELKIKPYYYKNRVSKFDINIEGNELENEGTGILSFDLEYCSKLFNEVTILRFVQYLKQLVGSILDNPNQTLAQLEFLPAREKEEILLHFNQTQASYPGAKTLHGLFMGQAEQTPDHIALVGAYYAEEKKRRKEEEKRNEMHLSYRELNEQSNHLAGMLIEKGIQPGNIVAIMMRRSIEMITGILGILKSGAAYLPIDPGYPQERIDYMLKDSNARILINKSEIPNPKSETNPNDQNTNDQNKNQYFGTASVLNFENLNLNSIKGCPRRGLQHSAFSVQHSNHLAYIIYTSGSTGKPKGVMIEHRSIVNYLNWAAQKYVGKQKINFPLYTSISFDLTITSIFIPLITGNAIVIYPEEGENAIHLIHQVMTAHHLGVIKTTPTHLKMALAGINQITQSPTGLKRLIVGGEELKVSLADEIYRAFNGNVEIYNEYGPTEAAVGCMIHRFDHNHDDYTKNNTGGVPIGIPIDNMQIYILDKYLGPVPYGVPGEIYISGEGVARGYLNNPELTAERFDQDLWDRNDDQDEGGTPREKHQHSAFSIQNSNLYHTGDLALRMPNGNIQFLGRVDSQVKIRGFRVETGEIEDRLREDTRIKQAVVGEIQDNDSDKFLCAYIVTDLELASFLQELKDFLSRYLPEYMIPSFYLQVDNIPVTVNGKVDWRKLNAHVNSIGTGMAKPQTSRQFKPPGNEMEKRVAAVWQEVLRQENISVNDNFFDLGGNSMAVIKVAARLQGVIGKKIPIVDMFLYTTVASLAGYLENLDKNKQTAPAGKNPQERQERDLQKREEMLLNTVELFQEVKSNDPA